MAVLIVAGLHVPVTPLFDVVGSTGALVLIVAGLHVPVIPLLDVAGREGAALFWHNGPICVNAGTSCVLMVTLSVAVVAHCPVFGVNV